MRSIGAPAAGAGAFFAALAMLALGFLPATIPDSTARAVSRAVRTDLGEVKWVRDEASDYTPLERVGRSVYIREGCWYCHSQYVRPVAGEDTRWGPVSEAGEYAFDRPHLLSTRRIGPDLARVGLKYGDDWHYAHLWDPRLVVPDSIMPSFKWLYARVRVRPQTTDGRPALGPSAELGRFFTLKTEAPIAVYPNAEGVAFVAPPANGQWPLDGTPVIDLQAFGDRPPDLSRVTLVFPTPELAALVSYLQKLGTSRGAWRDVFEPRAAGASMTNVATGPELLALGSEVYHARCAGCHGEGGDGNGPAATFLSPRPQSFTRGVFKFRSTRSGALPTDGDLYRAVTRGVRWTAMPTWHELPDTERLAVVAFIKTFSRRFKDERPAAPSAIGKPPNATAELVARGKALYQKAQCYQCHGADLPDFGRGQLKGGSSVRDVFRALTFGLDGSPMPSFADSTSEEERWALSYYVLSLSAWRDPLTALGSSEVAAEPPRSLLDLTRPRGLAPVALLMSLAALCALVWGAASGVFRDPETTQHSVLRAEMVEEAPRRIPRPPLAGGAMRAERILITLALLSLLALSLVILFNVLAIFLPIAY